MVSFPLTLGGASHLPSIDATPQIAARGGAGWHQHSDLQIDWVAVPKPPPGAAWAVRGQGTEIKMKAETGTQALKCRTAIPRDASPALPSACLAVLLLRLKGCRHILQSHQIGGLLKRYWVGA